MSNLEKHPTEILEQASAPSSGGVEVLEPREVPLGGPRAMSVRRTLPQRARSLIGAWCFVDHYGPDVVADRGGMMVPPHPHTGLQTVSWLFAGEIDHRDSVGSHAVVRPGELNLMTAGRGIAHSEISLPQTTVLHGAQLWIALPDGQRHQAPHFEHVMPAATELGSSRLRVFIGALAGASSPAVLYSDLVGAQVDIPAGESLVLPIDPEFEHGVLVDAGELELDGTPVPLSHLAYVDTGHSELQLVAGNEAVRALLIGGRPFGEQIVMWWNFIGRSHDEIVQYRDAWQAEIAAEDGGTDLPRFGLVPESGYPPLAAPVLPNVRLQPRG